MLPIIKCLVQACSELQIPYRFMDQNKNFVCVEMNKPFYFTNYTSPFGRHDIVRICKDKDFTHKLLGGRIRTPKTKGYLDPFCRKEYRKYALAESHEEIIGDVIKSFPFPMVVKRNQGTRGRNVFLCHDRGEVERAVVEIFNPESKNYDYVAIAQEFIPAKDEYRVVVFFNEIVLVYQKDIQNAFFAGNLSPLHWENARAVHIGDPEIIQSLENFIAPVSKVLELEFSGLDIIRDQQDRLWLLEINSQPDFAAYIRDNGEEPVVAIYRRMLQKLRDR